MLYACVNPFVARRNRPSAEDLTHALILPDDHDITLSKFPGVEKTGFGEPVHKELRVKMGVVDELLTDGTNRYWDPPRDAKGQPFSLYPYQLAGVTFTLAKKGRALIMDPMGLGKTLQGIGVLAAGGARNDEALPNDVPYMPAVVVCPGNAKDAWETDLREWTPHIKVRSAENPEEALAFLQSVRPQSPEVVIVKKQYVEELFQTYNAAITQLFSGVLREEQNDKTRPRDAKRGTSCAAHDLAHRHTAAQRSRRAFLTT
jgi:SNF2 family DNA or RNA helicase